MSIEGNFLNVFSAQKILIIIVAATDAIGFLNSNEKLKDFFKNKLLEFPRLQKQQMWTDVILKYWESIEREIEDVIEQEIKEKDVRKREWGRYEREERDGMWDSKRCIWEREIIWKQEVLRK